MNLKILLLFLFFVHFSSILPLLGQIEENFVDGDLSRNPVWSGDLNKFVIRQYEVDYFLLELNDAGKGSAMLATPSVLLRDAEWNFHFQLNGKALNKSSYARFYLSSDSPDLRGNIRGYFVDFGSNEGLVALVRQDGSLSDTVILSDSRAEMLLCATSSLDVRVTCSSDGEWRFYADIGAGRSDLWGIAMDATYTVSNYIGIYCTYTKTNCTNFSFGSIAVKRGSDTEIESPDEEEDEEKDNPPDSGGDPSDKEGFFLENRAFTPDGNGVKDEACVSYCFPSEGYTVRFSVYDASGHKLRTYDPVEVNQPSGDAGTTVLRWEGKNAEGDVVPVGIYLLVLEATHPSAVSIRGKLAVAVTR